MIEAFAIAGGMVGVFICIYLMFGLVLDSPKPKANDAFTINGYSKGFTWREEWSRGKQVTFMEPEPSPASPVVKVASRSIHDSLAMANADPSAYWLGPRDGQGERQVVIPICGIKGCKEEHYTEEEYRRALDARQYNT